MYIASTRQRTLPRSRSSRPSGVTLIQVISGLSVVAVLTAFAAANLLSSGADASESQALSTLRAIARAEASYRAGRRTDRDGDGRGEFGALGELCGITADGLRQSATSREKQLLELASTFDELDASGRGRRGGYLFQVYLPDDHGRGAADTAYGGRDVNVNAGLAAEWWCAYAWPTDDSAGARAFFVDHRGSVLATGMSRLVYDARTAPRWDAALDGVLGDMSDGLAVGVPAVDGNIWTPVR